MSDFPQFESVTPTVLDARRVSIHIKTINLPETMLGAYLITQMPLGSRNTVVSLRTEQLGQAR